MQLAHIPMTNLSVSAANMRAGRKAPDISDILPSVRARGVLVPLLVRQNSSPDTFEIIAGRRRFHAAQAVVGKGAQAEPLPCAIIEAGDDAAAVEASLIENTARLDPDEVTRWQTFTRLIAEGRSVEDIATVFGLPELAVKRVLALGNLHPRIRKLYAEQQIDAGTVRQLTLAPIARQKDWLALYRDPQAYVPRGHQLKAWLFGGASITTKAALFDLADYPAPIVADLFGEDSYFSDADLFWSLQMAAVAAKAEGYREGGWTVEVLERGQSFQRWEHEKVARTRGGKVLITVSERGEVEAHEGWLSRKEAQRLARGESAVTEDTRPNRPEITGAIQTYVDLHRHAAVRAKLTDFPSVALRLAVAHMIAGSSLWAVRVEAQRAGSDAIAESVESCPSEGAFDAKRREVLALLEFDAESPTVTGGQERGSGVVAVFAKLLVLDDEAVSHVLAVVMGETLEAGSGVVEAVGRHIGADLHGVYEPDDALFAGIRDREVLVAMLAEVAGPEVADANKAERGATIKAIIRDCLAGENGRPKAEGWLPRWLAFPPATYTARGGVSQVTQYALIATLVPAPVAG